MNWKSLSLLAAMVASCGSPVDNSKSITFQNERYIPVEPNQFFSSQWNDAFQAGKNYIAKGLIADLGYGLGMEHPNIMIVREGSSSFEQVNTGQTGAVFMDPDQLEAVRAEHAAHGCSMMVKCLAYITFTVDSRQSKRYRLRLGRIIYQGDAQNVFDQIAADMSALKETHGKGR